MGLISTKIVFRSIRSVAVIENTYQAANEHFEQMFILNKKSYIERLATKDNARNEISDNKSASRVIFEKTSGIHS